MRNHLGIALVLTAAWIFQAACGYRILGLFPYDGQSHFVMFHSIMKGLALKGHTVHVLSHYPLFEGTAIANYTDLSVAGSMALHNNQRSFKPFQGVPSLGNFLKLNVMFGMYNKMHEYESVMKSQSVQKLLKSNEKYDLIVTESFMTDMVLGFAHKFNVPFVLLSSCAAPPWTNAAMTNPQNPAFIPHFISDFSSRMSFFQRFQNALGLLTNLAVWHEFFVPASQRIMGRYFGDDTPPLLDIIRNASFLLINSHPTISGARPHAPNVAHIGGVHIQPAKKLPRDIEKFIEDSPHGVVYFCMGSVLRAATLPEEKKSAFFHTFSKLKERVLWKFEEEEMRVPDNILIKKWMPQRDILAHPKVKLFISHGGLLGLLETVSEGKPIVGISVTGDQGTNIRGLELQGMAKLVPFSSINNETIYESVQEMLKPKYAVRAKELSKLFHDRPLSPIDTAIYWIEHVIRSNGAAHLRSPAAHLNYYQYLLIDVILFLLICLIISSYLIFYTIKVVWFHISNYPIMKLKLKGE